MDNFNYKLRTLRFNKDNSEEYQQYRNKLPKEFDILSIQDFAYNKNIFLLVKKGILNREKIIGYAILFDCTSLNEEDKRNVALISDIDSKTILEGEWVFISDFMILWFHRRRGIGREFFRYIESNYYDNNDFILNADGDGKYFWRKLGFKYIDRLNKTMKKATRNHIKQI